MSGGITSQFGFVYQKEAFIYFLINEFKPGMVFNYEKLDDIDIEESE